MDAVQTVFQDYFPMIRFQLSDLLDIAILSFVIYKLLWMLRKTSSGRVMRGILIFLLAMFLSYTLDLTATSFVLDRVVELGILALVILFQPELRRLLEHVIDCPEDNRPEILCKLASERIEGYDRA